MLSITLSQIDVKSKYRVKSKYAKLKIIVQTIDLEGG